jgi:hypothetical protein
MLAAFAHGATAQNAPAKETIRVACIGETHTDMTKYDRELMKLLNADKPAVPYEVKNFGVPDSTIVQTEKPWKKTAKAGPAKEFQPNIVFFFFGTQDCQKGKNLNANATFTEEYEKLIKEYTDLPTKPKIFIIIPPAIVDGGNWGMTDENFQQKIVPQIKTVAKETGATLIDLGPAYEGKSKDLIHDKIHLVGKSKEIIADLAYKAITAKQGS